MSAFRFNDIEDIRAFETMLETHEQRIKGHSSGKFLEFAFLSLDIRNAGGASNHIVKNTSAEQPEDSILNSYASFSTRVGMLQHQSSLILRARAFWDKWMGSMVLIFDADNYDTFLGARRRKRRFLKIAKNWKPLPDIFSNQMLYELQGLEAFHDIVDQYERGVFFPGIYLQVLEILIDRLDSNYRTAEAHGTGVLRKWALSTQLEMTDPKAHGSVWVFNDVNMAMQSILGYFNDKETHNFLISTSYLRSKREASLKQ